MSGSARNERSGNVPTPSRNGGRIATSVVQYVVHRWHRTYRSRSRVGALERRRNAAAPRVVDCPRLYRAGDVARHRRADRRPVQGSRTAVRPSRIDAHADLCGLGRAGRVCVLSPFDGNPRARRACGHRGCVAGRQPLLARRDGAGWPRHAPPVAVLHAPVPFPVPADPRYPDRIAALLAPGRAPVADRSSAVPAAGRRLVELADAVASRAEDDGGACRACARCGRAARTPRSWHPRAAACFSRALTMRARSARDRARR